MPSIYRNNTNYGGVTFLAGSGVTAGIITAYGGTTAPTGWLMCDGSAVSRETYSELFKAIGTTYGSGDGSTTFNVPNLKGRVIVGAGESSATGHTNHTLGQIAGEETHVISEAEMPSHAGHLYSNSGVVYQGSATSRLLSVNSMSTYGSQGRGWNNNGSEAYPIGFDRGGGTAHNNMQPYTVMNYIISIGQQNGGFTHIANDGTDYNGGIDDKYLLLPETIEALDNEFDDSSGMIDQVFSKLSIDDAGVGYCKLPNGTLICWGTVTFPAASTGLQKVSTQFPVAFAAGNPWVVASWRDSDNTFNYMDYVYGNSATNNTTLVLAAKRLNASYNWYANYIAIGKW